MYSSARFGVNVGKLGVGILLGLYAGLGAVFAQKTPALSCDPALAALFTPARPQLGRYEVCTTPDALTAVAQPGWSVEAMAPLDAFGAGGSYDRAALARLYGGQRAAVARGWLEEGNRFESITLISPYPDRTFMRLVPGTLMIRHVIIR
jgi:hypothetical protein